MMAMIHSVGAVPCGRPVFPRYSGAMHGQAHYRRLSAASNAHPEQLADLKEELLDRFGPLPPEAETLFLLLGLKHPLRSLGISKVELAPVGLVFSFSETTSVTPETLIAFIERFRPKQVKPLKKGQKPAPDPVRLTPDGRLIVAVKAEGDLFEQIEAVLTMLGWSGAWIPSASELNRVD